MPRSASAVRYARGLGTLREDMLAKRAMIAPALLNRLRLPRHTRCRVVKRCIWDAHGAIPSASPAASMSSADADLRTTGDLHGLHGSGTTPVQRFQRPVGKLRHTAPCNLLHSSTFGLVLCCAVCRSSIPLLPCFVTVRHASSGLL